MMLKIKSFLFIYLAYNLLARVRVRVRVRFSSSQPGLRGVWPG